MNMKHWIGNGLTKFQYLLFRECIDACNIATEYLVAKRQIIGYLNALCDYELITTNDEYMESLEKASSFIKAIFRHERR